MALEHLAVKSSLFVLGKSGSQKRLTFKRLKCAHENRGCVRNAAIECCDGDGFFTLMCLTEVCIGGFICLFKILYFLC